MRSQPTRLLTAPSATSRAEARTLLRVSWGASDLQHFHSFRLILGEVGRGLAAYCGEGVYLDVALTWVVNRTAICPVAMREERGRPSGYSMRRLSSHFWRMVLTSGTRPLRLVALLGALLAVAAFGLIAWVVWARVTDEVPVQGWTSVMVVLLITSGVILLSLGVVAEYLGIAVSSAMGKPLYLVVSDPADGPLGRVAPCEPAGHNNAVARSVEPSTRAERSQPLFPGSSAEVACWAATSRHRSKWVALLHRFGGLRLPSAGKTWKEPSLL